MAERTSSVNADGIYEPFAVDAVPWKESSKGNRFACRFRQLGAFGGGSHVGVIMEELPPGKQSNIVHYHMLEEEHVLVLEGAMTLRLGGKSYDLSAGDYVCF
ncbi:MAG TPA: cupin domain-containing protein, partial [Alphaproteobacteria bacterium]|nr:cupin domain-containing protein [Alphaproteobacteria bacterium]